MSTAIGLSVLGFLFLGMLFGFYLYRELSRFVHRSNNKQGVCASCGEKAYVSTCGRCGLTFAMCHYYSVLGTSNPDPGKLGKRRGGMICVVCLSADEREMLERILGR